MPRPDVSEERRGQILDAAAAVFAKVGVRDARMDDIVEQADLSKGALYWYFKSKDDLVAAFIERLFMRGIESFRQFLKMELPFPSRMLAISRYVAADIRSIARLRSVALEYYALAARDSRVRRRVRGYLEESKDLFTTTIAQAIERGECRPIDAHKTALMLQAMYEGFTLLWVVGQGSIDIDETLEHSTRLFIDALKP